MNPTHKIVAYVGVEARSRRITNLLPLVSSFRHSKNTEALAASMRLQAAIRDLERLNDIEALVRAADDKTGPTLWLKIIEILEKD